MSGSMRRWVLWFCLSEAMLYAAFLRMDLRDGGGDTTWLKYGGVVLCAFFSLAWSRRGGDRLVAGAQLLTLGSDWFLLVLNRGYEWGVLLFCVVQLIYFLRIRRWNGGKSWWGARLALILAGAAGLWELGLAAPLNVLALIYFSNFLVNTLQSWEPAGPRARLFAAGLTLFLCCDACVGLFQFRNLLPDGPAGFVRVGMWLFYLPAQVVISLSALPDPFLRGDCIENK